MDKELNAVVAKNIRRFRKANGLSQEQLADICGLHRTYIGSVERGERNLTLNSLERIAVGLNRTPIELMQESCPDV